MLRVKSLDRKHSGEARYLNNASRTVSKARVPIGRVIATRNDDSPAFLFRQADRKRAWPLPAPILKKEIRSGRLSRPRKRTPVP